MSLQIVLHTFRMIFGNLGQALRVSVGPNLILIVCTFLAVGTLGLGVYGGGTMQPNQVPTGFGVLMSLLLIPLSLFVFAWVAVSWHRFILLEEYSGWLPTIKDRPIWPYVGKSILLALLMMLIMIPIMFIFGGLMAGTLAGSIDQGVTPTGQLRPSLVMIVSTALLAIPVSYVALRLGIALVGTALGKPMGFGDAWRKTKPVGMIILGVVVLLLAINLVGQVIILILYPLPLIPDLVSIAISWLSLMLGVSILTTIYGHVIEGRPLV